MPNYDYVCTKCGHEFSEFQFIKDVRVPCGLPCPKCKKKGVVDTKIGTPLIHSGRGMQKPPRAFREKLQGLKKFYRGSTINDHGGV